MTDQVETIIRATVKMDPAITPQNLELALKVLRGEQIASPLPAPVELDPSKLPAIISYKEACRILRISRSELFLMIKKGRLKRVYGSGGQGIGITRKSFLHVYEGKYGRCRD